MKIHFYRCDCEGPMSGVPSLPSGARFRSWSPQSDGPPPEGSRTVVNYIWWGLGKAGGFARSGFTELRVEQGGQTVHRLIVTPRWYRFPFMAPNDLQVGDVWTAPAARARNLARAAIREAHRRCGIASGRFWYVTAADNAVSGALAKSCGYRLVAVGRRTKRFGVALFGQYVIDRYVQAPDTETDVIAPDCSEESAAGRSLSVSH